MLCYKRGAKLKKRKNQSPESKNYDGHSDDSADANFSDGRWVIKNIFASQLRHITMKICFY